MLNEEELRAEVAAKEERMKSILWAPGVPPEEQDWSALLLPPEPVGGPATTSPRSTSASAAVPASAAAAQLPSQDWARRLAVLEQSVMSSLGTETQRRPANAVLPAWLVEAAGNPLTYDAREGRRTNVCARILPSTYASLKQTKARLGLRSIAGAWEYVLRLGLAAASKVEL